MEREMTPFFGFYCGVPMTGKTPPTTLMRAADVAERQALSPYISSKDAQALMDAAALMRAIAMAPPPPAEDTP